MNAAHLPVNEVRCILIHLDLRLTLKVNTQSSFSSILVFSYSRKPWRFVKTVFDWSVPQDFRLLYRTCENPLINYRIINLHTHNYNSCVVDNISKWWNVLIIYYEHYLTDYYLLLVFRWRFPIRSTSLWLPSWSNATMYFSKYNRLSGRRGGSTKTVCDSLKKLSVRK